MEFSEALNGFLAAAQKKVDARFVGHSYVGAGADLSIREGKKYIKVMMIAKGRESGSAFCFVEKTTGNVLKADGYNAPAKGIRSNIFAADFGASGVDGYGAVYHN